jgi:diguanylate cyclase (GGDEF)-like protein
MAGTADSDNLDAGAARKVLRLLEALRQSPAGGVIYRQVERMLDDLVSSNHDIQMAYAQIAGTLLDAYSAHLQKGSPLQIQVKLLRTRLQPPLSVADLQALKQYIDLYEEQIGQLQELDQRVFAQAVRPLLQAYGLEDAEPDMAVQPPVRGPEAPAAQAPAAAPPPDKSVERSVDAHTEPHHEWIRPQPARHPLNSLGGQPTLRREPEYENNIEAEADEDVSLEAEDQPASSYRSQLDARRRDIQELQAGLAQQVLDTIAQNEEFGVLLEVVLSELRQVGDISELENLRWTLIREIEKLMAGHHELADKLDSTHHYLQVIESDSRQLTDELTRVRLLSLTDELTGLPNRRAFLRRLEDEVARVQRYGFPLSLALIDLDKFKEINDKYGHAGGDEVLRVYSKNILSIFRHHDLVARYGGEEFAVLLPNTESEGALRALNKVKNRCNETRWQSNGSIVPVPTFSAGLALYKPGETSTAFVERVDKALYRAKRLGRNRIEIDMTYQTEAEARAANQKGGEPT